MKIIDKVSKFFSEYAPISNSEPWDNTGIIISNNSYLNQPQKLENEAILLTNDITIKVVDEAIKNKVNTIISYHPILFKKINKITDEITLKLIQNRIAVYSPHTSLDQKMCIKISELIGSLNIHKIEKTYVVCTQKEEFNLSINNFLNVLTNLELEPGNNNPTKIVLRHNANKIRDEKKINVIPQKIIIGMGASQEQFKSEMLKNINEEENEKEVSLIITGEMSHHDILYYSNNNIVVILMEHSVSERFYLKYLKEDMKKSLIFENIKILISEEDVNPVDYYIN